MAAFVRTLLSLLVIGISGLLAHSDTLAQVRWVQQPTPEGLAATVWEARQPGKDGSILLAVIPTDGAAPGEPIMLSAMFTATGNPLTIRQLVYVEANAAGIRFDLRTMSNEIPQTLRQTTDFASRLRVLRAGVEVGPTRGPWGSYNYYVPSPPTQYEVPFGATPLPVELVLTDKRLRASMRAK